MTVASASLTQPSHAAESRLHEADMQWLQLWYDEQVHGAMLCRP